MVVVDKSLDSNPTEELIEELAELRIRNLICFEELKAFNDTGQFKCKHPLVLQYSAHARYSDMLRNDPVKFLTEFKNVANNISRYQSFLNTKPGTEQDKAKWRTNLKKHTATAAIMKEILENHGK
ncbi:MAG: hypothetical protein EGP82_09335 [Odoribacter splanchnicus]|nr:hypothetical protein [Odoribacter splanchnicus]